ncbi:hypothetical protein GCM10020331_093030 [Ectobacillus funiculus]
MDYFKRGNVFFLVWRAESLVLRKGMGLCGIGRKKIKIGVVGFFSSHVNGKLVFFRVNGNYEKNDIIQRFWDKKM